MVVDTRFLPPLDAQAPEGKEAEWALLRLAQLNGVKAEFATWQELADAIIVAQQSAKR